MKQQSKAMSRPNKLFRMTIDGRFATIIFIDNIEETDNNEFTYDEYIVSLLYRDNLETDISNNFDKWLDFAKQQDFKEKSKEIRDKRDKLLAETDKEFIIDRLSINQSDDLLTELSAMITGDMATYRQALRDIPEQTNFPYMIEFPVKPKL